MTYDLPGDRKTFVLPAPIRVKRRELIRDPKGASKNTSHDYSQSSSRRSRKNIPATKSATSSTQIPP
jgi:hypothetical protein